MNCDWEDASPDEPCWGLVCIIDELWPESEDDEGWVVYGCEGHQDVWFGGNYKTNPEVF